MTRTAWRVGLFVLIGTALLVLGFVLVGGHWFARSEFARMQFAVSVQGLQPGAPVVFRGVRVGRVEDIGLAPPGPNGVLLPVTVSLDSALLRGLLSDPPPVNDPVVPALVAQGLVARLASQSLLTGLALVELDIDPIVHARGATMQPSQASQASGVPSQSPQPAATHDTPSTSPARPPLIPSAPNRLQSLQAQLEGLDVAQLVRDLQASAQAVRTALSDPHAVTAPARAAEAARALQQLAERLQHELPALATDARGAIGDARRAIGDTRRAIDETRVALVDQTLPDVRRATEHAGRAADQVQALAAETSPALNDLRRAAGEIGRAAVALRQAVDQEGGLRQNTERALQDVSRAARSVRALVDQLEQQPDALIRGRAASEP